MIIPRPKHTESEPVMHNDGIDYAWVKWYIDCPNWVCSECGHTQFGRNKRCAYCMTKLGIETLRPKDYKENEYGS
jgi:hypothetical protein